MAMSNILLKEVTMGLCFCYVCFLIFLLSYADSSLAHYESQSLPSQHEFLFEFLFEALFFHRFIV